MKIIRTLALVVNLGLFVLAIFSTFSNGVTDNGEVLFAVLILGLLFLNTIALWSSMAEDWLPLHSWWGMKKVRTLFQNRKFSAVFVVVLLAVSWFYWYEWRPAQIRKVCAEIATGRYELSYGRCLNERGLDE